MAAGPKIHRNPLVRLIQKLATAAPGTMPDLRMDKTPCRACSASRPIDGLFLDARTFDLAKGRPIFVAQIGLTEFPSKPGGSLAWSHFGLLNVPLSEQAQGPIYAWQSLCDREACSGKYSVVEQLAALQGRDLAAQSQRGMDGMTNLDCCDSCGTRRDGVKVDAKAATGGPDGAPMAIIRLYELDVTRDLNPRFAGKPVARWCFTGYADLDKPIAAGVATYRWSMTCPECVTKQQRGLANTPLLYVAKH